MQPVSIKYRIFPEVNLVLAEASGDVDFEDVKRLIVAVQHETSYKVGMNLLYDGRQVTGVKGDPEAFQQAAEYVSNEDAPLIFSKTAFLLTDAVPSLKVYVEGYILMTSASKVERKIFVEADLESLMSFLSIDRLPTL